MSVRRNPLGDAVAIASGRQPGTLKASWPLGRLVPQLRGQKFTERERETVRRQAGRARAAAERLENALGNGEGVVSGLPDIPSDAPHLTSPHCKGMAASRKA